MDNRIGQDFFVGKTVEQLAMDLLGCELVHDQNEGITSGIIVETEAYHQTDEASHAYRGKTPRTSVMFEEPGHAYVYFTYGMHWCFNITAEDEGVGAGVLIRALEPTAGIKIMKKRRGKDLLNLCNGPSKLVQAMGITKSDYGKDLTTSNLYLKPRRQPFNQEVSVGPRIGISKAVKTPWRFWISGNKFVSHLPKS